MAHPFAVMSGTRTVWILALPVAQTSMSASHAGTALLPCLSPSEPPGAVGILESINNTNY